MLQALKDFGNVVGLDGFKSELQKKVNTGDKIIILNIDQNLSLKEEKRIGYDEKEYEDPYLFYYKGGNDSAITNNGVMGISPFFLMISNITEDRVNKSNEYDEIYKKLYSFDSKYKQYLKDNEVVDKELRSALSDNGIILSENAKIFNTGKNIWQIKEDESWLYKIEIDKDKQLNICDFFIREFLDFLKTNAEKIKSMSEEIGGGKGNKWVYFNSFKGKTTEDIHKKFIGYYIKEAKQNKQIENIEGKCSLCGELSELCCPRLKFFSVGLPHYNHDFDPHNNLEHSKLRICKNCESEIVSGWNYLYNLFRGGYAIIPKLRDKLNEKLLEEFIKIVNNNLSDFEKLNEVLKDKRMDEGMELSFIVMKKSQQKILIKKFVGNYKTFAIRFEKEYLIKDHELKYVDWESNRIDIPQITSFFELERILKFFFVNDKNYPLRKNFYFYNLYNQDLPKNIDSNFKHSLYVHRDELFSFIYETNISTLKRKTLNEVCLNFLLYEIRKQREFWGKNAELKLPFKIMEALNYYYFFKTKILNESKMKDQIIDLKSKFEMLKEENITDDKISEVFSEIQKIVEQDDRIVYYLIGQFIRIIDNKRWRANKNTIFNDFIQNINRKNIKQRFAEDILRKQNYYIERLNPRAKLVFDVMSNNMDNLFKYEPYEEIVIYIITGYYSNNMLKIKNDKQK